MRNVAIDGHADAIERYLAVPRGFYGAGRLGHLDADENRALDPPWLRILGRFFALGVCGLTVEGLENASRLPALVAALDAAGYPDGAVAKILGGNFRRVLGSVQP